MTVTLDRPPTQLTGVTLTLVPLSHPSLRRVHHWDDQEALHKAVMGLFPSTIPGDPEQRRAKNGILHRYDTPAHGPARLLIQHSTPLRPGLATDTALMHTQLQPLLVNLHVGTGTRFRVVLNAVRSQTRSHRRVPITDLDDLVTWGLQRLTAAGLDMIQLVDQPRTTLGTTGKSPLWTAQYDGHARITDPDTTRRALLNGLGRAKAYGCGLLSLAPDRA